MNMRERSHDQRERPTTSATPTPTDGLRTAAERVWADGAEAIAEALSQDSAAFLSSNLQTVGQ